MRARLGEGLHELAKVREISAGGSLTRPARTVDEVRSIVDDIDRHFRQLLAELVDEST